MSKTTTGTVYPQREHFQQSPHKALCLPRNDSLRILNRALFLFLPVLLRKIQETVTCVRRNDRC